MANQGLTTFEFQNQQIRIVMQDGSPWFVAKDVCDVLELSNSRMVLERLDEDERGVSTVYTPGGAQQMAVVSEPGLYSLVMTSRKPEAKLFKRWITHDVMPSIRKHGVYAKAELLDNPELLLDVVTKLTEERRSRLAEKKAREAAEAQLIEQAPLVTFAETCLTSKDSILVRELAKVASKNGVTIGQNRLYERLREWGLILKGSTEPTQRAIDAGYFEVIQRPIEGSYGTILRSTTKVTPKGQVYIVERLRADQGQLTIV